MKGLYQVGLDVQKKTISFCVKDERGAIYREGQIRSARSHLDQWCQQLPGPWMGALEATLFSEWIYDHLQPQAQELKVAHPARLQALVAGKKKNDRIDARLPPFLPGKRDAAVSPGGTPRQSPSTGSVLNPGYGDCARKKQSVPFLTCSMSTLD